MTLIGSLCIYDYYIVVVISIIPSKNSWHTNSSWVVWLGQKKKKNT